jgi:hypothetical protein
MRLFGLTALVVAVFATAAMADTPPPGASEAAGAPAKPTPLSIWRLDEAGAAEHLQTGLGCPARVGEFDRTQLVNYDALGFDVDCNYRRADGADLTVYLTRRSGTSAADAVTEAKRELMVVRAGLHPALISETRPAVGGLDWSYTLYALDGGYHSAIWIADLDGWTLEYRVTYLAPVEAQALAEVAAMTDLVQRSAGARLGLCAKSPAAARSGTAITDTAMLKSAAMLTALTGGAAKAALTGGKAIETPRPVVWCVERGIPTPKVALLFWRGVHADGSDGNTDKISAMTIGEPPALVVASDEMGNIVAKAKNQPDDNWVATTQRADLTRVYGYFNGRPSAELLSGLFMDVLTGQAKPLVGYGADGKSITISMPSDK